MFRKTILIILLCLVLAMTAAVGCTRKTDGEKPSVTVGSKHFTETFILAEMMALLLEDAGFQVKRVIPLGGTEVAQKAIQTGEIDIYPEYTSGGIITGVLKLQNDPAITDPAESYRVVKEEFKKQFDIEVLSMFGFNNNYCHLITKKMAEEFKIKSNADLKQHATSLKAGYTHEYTERSDGYKGFKVHYGFEFGKVVPLDSGLLYDALKNGDVDVISGFATDGRIVGYNLINLEDDKQFFAPQMGVPLVRGDVLAKYPQIADILNKLEGKLTNQVMQALNYKVDGEKMEPADVARKFLKDKGLIK